MNRTREDDLNAFIKIAELDTNKISDGYHTFGQLYDHRVELYIALCRILSSRYPLMRVLIPGNAMVWRSKLHSDGASFDGWFILGIESEPGEQITYHLPLSKWNDCGFSVTLDKAPEFDGHTSEDVLKRLAKL